MAGTKTVTRRPCNDNPRSPWWRQRCALEVGRDYAVQAKRGTPAIGRVTVVSVRRETLAAMQSGSGLCTDEAVAEGFSSFEAFRELWTEFHGGWDPLLEVWRVEFVLVSS